MKSALSTSYQLTPLTWRDYISGNSSGQQVCKGSEALSSLETFSPFERATEEERAASCGPQNPVSAFSSPLKKNSGNNFDWSKCWRKAPPKKISSSEKEKTPQRFQKELWTNIQEGNFLHFLMVSIGPPARRASFTAFSSFLAAALGAFFLTTTGSQSCDTGPIPAMAPFSFSPSLQKRKKQNQQLLNKYSIHPKKKWFQKRTTYSFSMSCLLSLLSLFYLWLSCFSTT